MWRIYDVRTGQQAFALKARGLVFSPDGSRIAAESDGKDGVLRVYDGRTGQDVFTIKGWSYPFSGAVFSPDGARVAASGADGVVRAFDARTGQEAFALKAPAALGSPVFSPDGTNRCLWQ